MFLNDVLVFNDIDPTSVLIMRHKQEGLGIPLPWIAAERPEMFAAFQSTHNVGAERSLRKRECVASFVGLPDGRNVFVGLYRNRGDRPITFKEFHAIPVLQLLFDNGYRIAPKEWREDQLWFDLQQMDVLFEYTGRLLIQWDGKRNMVRLAENYNFPISAILEENALTKEMPDWRDLILTWSELKVLPHNWKTVLTQWRGIYYIHDRSMGRGYVGAAYGNNNILGRWLNYADTGHGDNKLLKKCNPENFSFSILERLSPDLEVGEVTVRESSWKERLHTRASGLNAN